jgi:hypothetical protein
MFELRPRHCNQQDGRLVSPLPAQGGFPPHWTEYHNIHRLKPKEECRLQMERASGAQQLLRGVNLGEVMLSDGGVAG